MKPFSSVSPSSDNAELTLGISALSFNVGWILILNWELSGVTLWENVIRVLFDPYLLVGWIKISLLLFVFYHPQNYYWILELCFLWKFEGNKLIIVEKRIVTNCSLLSYWLSIFKSKVFKLDSLFMFRFLSWSCLDDWWNHYTSWRRNEETGK